MINRLIEIKKQLDELYTEQAEVLQKLADENKTETVLENEDGTYTRVRVVDNLAELTEKGILWKSTSFNKYSADIKVLKNKPKE